MNNQTLQLVLLILVAVAMLVQAVALMGVFITLRKASETANEKIEEIRTKVVPLIDTTNSLFTKLGPKIEAASDDMAAIAHTVRTQTADLQAAATEIVERARVQAGRLDGMLSNVLDTMDRAGGFVADAINKPVRQLNALMASAKAVIESLRSTVPTQRSRSNHAPGDGDMFV